VCLVLKVHKVIMVHKDQLDHKVILVRRVHKDQQVRRV